jgi:hypothetical protein
LAEKEPGFSTLVLAQPLSINATADTAESFTTITTTTAATAPITGSATSADIEAQLHATRTSESGFFLLAFKTGLL